MAKFKKGQIYRIATLTGRRKTDNKITGKLIHQNENHFTIQDKRGIRESFLKADIMIREYGITAL